MKSTLFTHFGILYLFFLSTCLCFSNNLDSTISIKIDTISTLKNQSIKTETYTNIEVTEIKFEDNLPTRKKFWPALCSSFLYNSAMGGFLLLMPDEITNWHKQDKFKFDVMMSQYKSSFNKPPVIDPDFWYINYLGHPYQGSYYFNTFRSRGGSFWQSALFNLGQSSLWEYVWEGGLEQPSIQDLIVTPVLGSLIGELAHKATLKMAKNGFRWYEIISVCLINPAYVINNGFKTKAKKNNSQNITQ